MEVISLLANIGWWILFLVKYLATQKVLLPLKLL